MVSAMYGFQDEQLGVLPELPCSRCPDDVVLGALIPVVFRPFRRVRRQSCVHLASCLMLLALARFVMLDASVDENRRFFTMFLVLTACRVVLIKRSPLQEVNEASRILICLLLLALHNLGGDLNYEITACGLRRGPKLRAVISAMAR